MEDANLRLWGGRLHEKRIQLLDNCMDDLSRQSGHDADDDIVGDTKGPQLLFDFSGDFRTTPE